MQGCGTFVVRDTRLANVFCVQLRNWLYQLDLIREAEQLRTIERRGELLSRPSLMQHKEPVRQPMCLVRALKSAGPEIRKEKWTWNAGSQGQPGTCIYLLSPPTSKTQGGLQVRQVPPSTKLHICQPWHSEKLKEEVCQVWEMLQARRPPMQTRWANTWVTCVNCDSIHPTLSNHRNGSSYTCTSPTSFSWGQP